MSRARKYLQQTGRTVPEGQWAGPGLKILPHAHPTSLPLTYSCQSCIHRKVVNAYIQRIMKLVQDIRFVGGLSTEVRCVTCFIFTTTLPMIFGPCHYAKHNMQPIVTDVPRSVCVCLSVCLLVAACAKMAELTEMCMFGI